VARRVDEAFNAFRREQSSVTSKEDLETCIERLGALILHRVFEIRGLGEFSRSCIFCGGALARAALSKAYGRDWNKRVFDIASRGSEGGLYGVLKRIAETMGEEFSRNAIGSIVSEYLDRLSLEQRREAVQEYVRRYGSLFQIDEVGALLTRVYFGDVLSEHPWLMKRLERAGPV
jgi:hypothetical protein